MRANSDLWIKICRERIKDSGLLQLAEQTHKITENLSKSRSDFVHATFENEHHSVTVPLDGIVAISRITTTPVAIRTKNRKKADITELKKARDEAARMSRILAHIEHVLKNEPQPSPWLGKF